MIFKWSYYKSKESLCVPTHPSSEGKTAEFPLTESYQNVTRVKLKNAASVSTTALEVSYPYLEKKRKETNLACRRQSSCWNTSCNREVFFGEVYIHVWAMNLVKKYEESVRIYLYVLLIQIYMTP